MSDAPTHDTPAPTTSRDDHPYRYGARLADDIETRWQNHWREHKTFRTPNPDDPGFDADRPAFYCLDMFPYPSGAGLHVGHPEGYTATDIVCRYKRMTGHNVLHPMGWDAFGLPAEQYAIQTGVHPAETTRNAIDNFRRQLQRFGFCYDWDREFATIDEDYYRWTQWIWLMAYESWFDEDANRARPIAELVEEFRSGARVIQCDPECPRGFQLDIALDETFASWDDMSRSAQRQVLSTYRLAYLAEQTVNWCPKLGTALANEEVIDGRSERGGYPVHRTPLRQWMFRITAFADRLLADLDHVDWPQSTRSMQSQWIGRSEGAEIRFPIAHDTARLIEVFTTRPDTMFGATFMVVAPEHPLVQEMLESPQPETNVDQLRAYVEEASNRADVDRMADSRDKTGVFTGAYAVNPASGERIQIWTADYVLMGYGHGAIMAVPAHDERDFDFATAFGLPIRDVVYTGPLGAVASFCHHIAEAGGMDSDTGERLLVDYVALLVNEPTHDHDEAWKIVRERRADNGGSVVAERRSTISSIWRDALKDVLRHGFESLIEDGANGRLHQRLGAAAPEAGVAANSCNDGCSLNGLSTEEAKAAAIAWLDQSGHGRGRVNYKLRDWLFSRQRYWGEPFPIVYDEDGNHYPVSSAQLPVTLPAMTDYRPVESDTPQPLLAKAEDWVHLTAGEAGVDPELLNPDTPVRRETNTMPGWAGSCWYFLRYCDPDNNERFVSRSAERYWMLKPKKGVTDGDSYGTFMPDKHHVGGVDLYIGGSEHAVLHLLYARFWHKILFDLGEVSTPEPFGKLFHQGLITSFAYRDKEGRTVPVDEVEERDGVHVLIENGEPVEQIVAKMSKTLKNVVNPDDVIAEFGADTFRLYEMYMGPLDASKPWNTRDIVGPFRFLQRTWRLLVNEDSGETLLRDAADDTVEKQLHRTIARVGDDIERLSFNTGIAALIEFVNAATSAGGLTTDQAHRFLVALSPFAPHIADELASRIGHEDTLADEPWPAYDESMLKDDEVEIAVQILGKVRGKVTVPADSSKEELEAAACAEPRIAELLEGKTIRKIIVVPGKLVNIVAN